MKDSVIDLTAHEQFTRDFQRLMTTDQQAIMRKGGERAGAKFDELVRNRVPPPVRKQAAAQYWTAKQTRWWWATMHAKARGDTEAKHVLPGWKAVYKRVDGRKTLVLSGGYRRTGTLVRSLTYAVAQTNNVTTVSYGTNRAYAKWVIDEDDQAKYHQGNWPTLQALAREYADEVMAEHAEFVQAEIARRLER